MIALREISDYLKGKSSLKEVRIVLFDEESLNVYLQLLKT
jgi:O-acetyl-ADP-ribose deacetylase (regulator of RNase III)